MSSWLFLKSVVVAAVAADQWLEDDGSENDLGRMQDETGIEGERSAFKLFSGFKWVLYFISKIGFQNTLGFPSLLA